MKKNQIGRFIAVVILVIALASIATVTVFAAGMSYSSYLEMAPASTHNGDNRSYQYANFECTIRPTTFFGNAARRCQVSVGKLNYILGILVSRDVYATREYDIPNINTTYAKQFGNIGSGTRNFTFKTQFNGFNYAGFRAEPVVMSSYS